MTRKRYYFYHFSDGYEKHFTPQEAAEYAKEHGVKITKDGLESSMRSIRRVKDGFQPGYNPALGEYVGGPREYQQKLKERGLVEMGKERLDHKDYGRQNLLDKDDIKEIVEMGGDISDSQAEKLISDS